MAYPTYIPPVTSRQASSVQPQGACPICGGLQCLCRPRFFAGQLLTEEDLNRLDRYIVEKNKLHNRYLHGWGTVCGLEVLCHHCKGEVIVKSGYAIGPCGEDIVVCKDDVVDVCDLIRKCKEKERRDWECESPFTKKVEDDGCKEGEETWALAIRYDEKPSRGITALRGSTEAPCCSRCCCGGSSACGCSCHEEKNNGKSASSYQKSRKQILPQCEDTVICEGYKYEVFRVTRGVEEKRQDPGRLGNRFNNCFNELVNAVKEFPMDDQNNQDLCCRLKDFSKEFFIDHPVGYCEFLRFLEKIDCTNGLDDLMKKGRFAFFVYLFHCFCSSLLPPCPDPVQDPRVVLATIRVPRDDCNVIQVCNWTTLRKFVTSFPSLQYWLSWVPFGRQLREILQGLCCIESLVEAQVKEKIAGAAGAEKITISKASVSAETNAFGKLLRDAVSELSTLITPEVLFKGMKGLAKKDGGLEPIELENPLQFLLLNQLVQPLFGEILRSLGAGVKAADLKDRVLELEEGYKTTSKEIKRLAKVLQKKSPQPT